MITTEDMALLVSRRVNVFGMPVYVKGHIPFTEYIPSEGRITIIPKEDSDGNIFDKCFVEVNFILPDVQQEADIRLDDIEREACRILKESVSYEYEGQWYRISYSRRSRERDEQLKSHYVHFQLLFEILNTL